MVGIGLGAAPTDTIEQNRKTARFGDSVDPNQGYLILAVQPVGGTKLQKTRSVHDARTPAKMRRYNHADCVGADVAFRCDGRPEISNSGAAGLAPDVQFATRR